MEMTRVGEDDAAGTVAAELMTAAFYRQGVTVTRTIGRNRGLSDKVPLFDPVGRRDRRCEGS
jgi:hypothetical protein